MLVAVVATACFSSLADLDGLAGPDVDAATAEAGDAGSGDAATAFCARASHVFCDDFDDGELGARWTSLVQGAVTVGFDTGDYRSAPRSLRLTVPSAPDGGSKRPATYLQTAVAPSQTLSIGFDVVATPLTSGAVALLVISLEPAPDGFTSYTLELALATGAGLLFQEQNGAVSTPVPLSVSSWTTVALKLDLTSGTAQIVDGSGAEIFHKSIAVATSKGARISLGVPYLDSTAAFSAKFDDVFVDK
jgi:hypothetical protein